MGLLGLWEWHREAASSRSMVPGQWLPHPPSLPLTASPAFIGKVKLALGFSRVASFPGPSKTRALG